MNLARFDLNLLKTLDALEHERSVQRAALQLNVTASAVSHALARLRHAFGDPLFVRSSAGLDPTPRCRVIVQLMRPFLAAANATLAGEPPLQHDGFDPATDRRHLRMAMPGAVELSLLPEFVARLRRAAPLWTLEVKAFQRRSYEADLLSGAVDVVLSVGGHTPRSEGLTIDTLWEDELVVLQGPEGPFLEGEPVTLDRLVDTAQIYPLPWPITQNYLDIRLARRGRRRALTLAAPSYASVGATLMRTNLVASMPGRTACAIQENFPQLAILRIMPAMHNPLIMEVTTAFAKSTAGHWLMQELRAAGEAVPTAVGQGFRGQE